MDCSMPGFAVLHYLPEFAQNSCPLSQWCYLTISSSAALFSFCLQSFPGSGSFLMSCLFTSGGQRSTLTLIFTVFGGALHPIASRILVPWPGIEPRPRWVLITRPPGNYQFLLQFKERVAFYWRKKKCQIGQVVWDGDFWLLSLKCSLHLLSICGDCSCTQASLCLYTGVLQLVVNSFGIPQRLLYIVRIWRHRDAPGIS